MTKKKKTSFNLDAPLHVTGRTQYLDDLPELAGTLYKRLLARQLFIAQFMAVKEEELVLGEIIG